MGQTREKRKEQTRELILEAAQALILEVGFEKLSLRAVARKVSYSPAGLYEYFANKEELTAAVARRAAHKLSAYLQTPSESDPLVGVGLAYIQFAKENPEEFLLLFSRLMSKRQSHDEEVPETSPYQYVVGQVQRSLEEGRLQIASDVGSEDIAYALWALCHGAAMLQITHLQTYQADFMRADRLAIRALLAGFRD